MTPTSASGTSYGSATATTSHRNQLDLRPCPDIVHAQIRHQRILRSRGRPAARSAFLAARGLWAYMSTAPGYTWQRDARTARISAQARVITAEEAAGSAVTYPETVALTAILASPAWRTIALSRKPADSRRFHHELRRRVTTSHTDSSYPRLLFWIRRDLECSRYETDDTGPYPRPHRPARHLATVGEPASPALQIKQDAS